MGAILHKSFFFLGTLCTGVLVVLTAVVSLGAPPGRAQILTYVDGDGRRVFNAEDQELRAAAVRGGAAAALRVIEQRKRALPGIERFIRTVGLQYGIDPELVRTMIEVESAWNPRARSRQGALGLMQLLPETGTRFGVRNIFDPMENVLGGIRYLRFLLDLFGGDLQLALAAYNAGENAVTASGGIPPYVETQDYLARVKARYRKLGRPRQIYGMVENGRVVFAND